MPISAPPWTEFLTCPICSQDFNENPRQPISLACGHTVCKSCLASLHRTVCPFDQSTITIEVGLLPINHALLQLLGYAIPDTPIPEVPTIKENQQQYLAAKKCIEELALFLKPLVQRSGSPSEMMNNGLTNGTLSRPMHRKLVTLVNCQLAEEEGCARVMRAVRSLGERTILEFILLHQNSAQLSGNLWMAVRNRGCQFLGPAMQEDALKFILLALEGGEALSRKVLVLFVVQRLEQNFPHASKTSIGHVVQLLYRASCFKVTKRDDESSLMQLKEQFRTYDALRREHDSQIVQIALEAGLRISPEQWSALLYGDQGHKSHMQSIIDKLQTPESFASSIQELTIALRRSSDPAQLGRLKEDFELLSGIDGSPDAKAPTWLELEEAMKAVNAVVQGLVDFTKTHGMRVKTATDQPVHSKFKTSMCRDYAQRGACPRGVSCTFAHSDDELDKYRRKAKTTRVPGTTGSSMVNARGSMVMNDHQQYGGPPPEHGESPLENGIGTSRNGPMRTSPPHGMTNGQDYSPSSNGGYGQLMMRNNNHSNPDMMVQQLRNLNMHSSSTMYSAGQENGFNLRNTMTSDCLTPPAHTSEQSFNYPTSYYGRNGYSTMNGGQMNGGQMNGGQMNGGQMNGGQMNGGHIDVVTRQGPTRTSPLTIEEASINCLNGVNGIVGMNGLNGVNGLINGHSDYASRQQHAHADEIRRRKIELSTCGGAPRYRCAAQYTLPSAYSAFPSSPYYQADVSPRYGPVGTRLLPDADRFAYPPHVTSNGRMCAPVDGRLEVFHPSFHPSNRPMWGKSPAAHEDSEPLPSDLVDVGTSPLSKNDKDAKSCLFLPEDSTSIDEPTFTRPHLSSVSSGVSSGESYGSHSPRSHSPMSSPQQHSPDAWTGDSDIGSSLWSNGDFPPGPFFSPRSEENGLVTKAEVWKPFESELSGWTEKLKDSGNEADESAIWPPISTKKRPGLQAVLESDPLSGYWSDPEDQRFKQIKDDEVIARTLQEDHSLLQVKPSAPPQIYNNHRDNDNDATIALELQTMENEEHEMKIGKEMKDFEERKVKEMIKMNQEEEDRKMAIRVQNEEGLTFVTDEATIKLHEKLYKESMERMKEQSTKENQEKKDRELAECLVYEDAYKHGILKRPNAVLANSLKYPVKVVPRGATRAKISSSPTYDVMETALP